MKNNSEIWDQLKNNVIDAGLCTHCGTCVGLNVNKLSFEETSFGPIPKIKSGGSLNLNTYKACPGKGVPYPQLFNQFYEGYNNYLTGNVINSWIGFSKNKELRMNSASGGVITSTLLFLLKSGLIDGAVVLKSGEPGALDSKAIIATTEGEIIKSAQSVYMPIPVNIILSETKNFNGKLAFVGLPDQVASIRMLQMFNDPSTENIDFILGPYTGTNMYRGAIRSFLRGRGVKDSIKISSLKWRAGEWPGYLEVICEDGRVFKAEKFYYNYLTPFFITKASLLACDFTNELTDISVGDAWSPIYEKQRKGFSVVLSRTERGDKILKMMLESGYISLEGISLNDALGMHGHMLDFKKRGSFIRMEFKKLFGKKVPEYGYRPLSISLSRKFVEVIVSGIFLVASKRFSRKVSEFIPISILGPTFNFFRIYWKKMSKPTKRKGLLESQFIIDDTK
tara:strand:+ start:8271 stop:9623 length:1353 start_codon:yes stop_codon:yes gene_type:complete